MKILAPLYSAGDIQIGDNNVLKTCVEGNWHTLCENMESWTAAKAQVVCCQKEPKPQGQLSLLL